MGTSLIVFILIIGFLLWELFYSTYFFKKGKRLSGTAYTKNTEIGNRSKPIIKILIAGDSIGAGVGASSFETSAAGRTAYYLSRKHYIILKNISVNGNRIVDLLKNIPKEKFNLIIIFISSNDLLRFTDLKEFEKDTINTLKNYSQLTKKLIVVGPANVGLAKIVPVILRLIYLYRAPKYAVILKKASSNFKNIVYINSLLPSKSLGKYLQRYYSPDKFHPNDEGHKFWFGMIKPYL